MAAIAACEGSRGRRHCPARRRSHRLPRRATRSEREGKRQEQAAREAALEEEQRRLITWDTQLGAKQRAIDDYTSLVGVGVGVGGVRERAAVHTCPWAAGRVVQVGVRSSELMLRHQVTRSRVPPTAPPALHCLAGQGAGAGQGHGGAGEAAAAPAAARGQGARSACWARRWGVRLPSGASRRGCAREQRYCGCASSPGASLRPVPVHHLRRWWSCRPSCAAWNR